ncbi:hypothetical protein [Anaerococcus degeneri]|uniref:DUF5673 domain-containing protein n=1 Tax=Anaerococcus degeneri TaxID=361500 RepID=A0ABS7YWU8_9FIRM|nr:hypothetical protein [Anaerococcus degeneri]MBP2015308.1 hypothetical protein [Anaerococcus degeneri]MCA2096204.1 hypothetical protein [Anaerococcus degeneri]
MPQLIFILASLFALAGLYNMYLFGQIKEKIKFTTTDLAVLGMMVVMFIIYYWVFKPYPINALAISLAMIFWNYTGTIARGFSDEYVFTNKLNPFINKKVPLGEIKSVTLSRANKNLLLMVYLKTANSQDNMSFAFSREKDLVKILKNQKVNVIN